MVKFCGNCGRSYEASKCGQCMKEPFSQWTPAAGVTDTNVGNKQEAKADAGMSTETFERIMEEQLNRCRDVLVNKAKEYATGDRLHNFRVAAQLRGCTPEQALAGMMAKHTVSVYDMCESGKIYPVELWAEKITDSLNYLLLLNALVREGEQV